MEDDDSILIPFVLTKKHGGEYDNEAFNAGWNLALLDARLTMATTMNLIITPILLPLKWKKMADLIAMSHELVSKVHASEEFPDCGIFMFGEPRMFQDDDDED